VLALPKQKGSVENLVGFVKSSFFKVRKFYDEEDRLHKILQSHGAEVLREAMEEGLNSGLMSRLWSSFCKASWPFSWR